MKVSGLHGLACREAFANKIWEVLFENLAATSMCFVFTAGGVDIFLAKHSKAEKVLLFVELEAVVPCAGLKNRKLPLI